MFDFNEMLNWKLKVGSHPFPGPNGGTCINEAAVVAAGLEYREVTDADDLPECFSRPISQFALRLNDIMPAKLRQRLLMPFVLRLADTADSPKIEIERARTLIRQCTRNILPYLINEPDLNPRFRTARTNDEIIALLCAVAAVQPNNAGFIHMLDVLKPIDDYKLERSRLVTVEEQLMRAVDAVARLVQDAAKQIMQPTAIYGIGARLLDEALQIGRQANRADVAAAARHLNAARQFREKAQMRGIQEMEKLL
jgi:hypothetical protein